MTRTQRLLAVIVAGALAAGTAALVGDGGTIVDLVLLSAAVVATELFELRPVDRAPLSLSFAVVVVLVRAATPIEFVIIVVSGYLIAAALRESPTGVRLRALLFVERLAEAAAAVGAYRLILESEPRHTRALVLGALAGAAVAQIIAADVFIAIRERRVASWRARGADLALATSGVLMAVGYDGIHGQGRFGLWGPLLFSIPLVAAWYSFELVASTRRGFRQTMRALGAVAEIGGLVRAGHSERVADLASDMGRDLGMSTPELADLETAAVMHHFGALCLDEPATGSTLNPVDVASFTSTMLRTSDALAPAGDIVAAEHSWHRPPGDEPSTGARLAGQVLKVASAYDELTDGRDEHADWAVEALYTGPGYVYDGRVLAALERVLSTRDVRETPD